MSKKSKLIIGIVVLIIAAVAGIYMSTSINMVLTKQAERMQMFPFSFCIESVIANRQQQLMVLVFTGVALCTYISLFVSNFGNYKAEQYEVTPKISIPKPCGQGQHGTSWWMSDNVFKLTYAVNTIKPHSGIFKSLINSGYDDLPPELQLHRNPIRTYIKNKVNEKMLLNSASPAPEEIQPFEKGGLVIGLSNKAIDERLAYVENDTHALILGVTRCGKTRCLVMQTIVNLSLAGENIVVSDPKGELYQYTYPFLERLGYNVLVLDYKNMQKSMSYNLLQPIIEQFKVGNTNRAIQLSRDIANILVGEKSKNGEPIWHNGELSIVGAIIIACVYDNMDRPENQNLTYVYEFLVRMCEEKKDGMPLQRYLKDVGEKHPANLLMAQANIAPSKTRGSFYTAAASTLSIWTDRELYHLAKKSDFELLSIVKKKTALFIILPDDKDTFYPVATLIVSQLYEQLAEYTDVTLGTGRLKNRLNFVLDEFGNFAEITNFKGKLTVAGGRGVRFFMFVQTLKQLNEKYSDNVAETIKANCDTWVYLKANDQNTKDEIVHKLGTYTTSSYSMSSSKTSSGSESMNLISRSLLTPEEVGRIERPYQIVMGNGGQRVSYAPDLSKWKSINKMLGLGNEEHNEKVRQFRDQNRKLYNDVSAPVAFNDPVWLNY